MMRSFLKSCKVLKFQIISSYSQKMNFDTPSCCVYTLCLMILFIILNVNVKR